MGRTKYKNYWYPGVLDAIKHYESAGDSRREKEVKQAIKETMEEILEEDKNKNINDGAATIQIVNLSLIKHTHTLEGAIMTVPGLSYMKAKRLRWDFVYRVAKKIGY